MENIFLSVLNRSLVAGWMIMAVILFRGLFPKVPKNIRCVLWGLVGIRLVCPFTIESIVSLIPSTKVVTPQIMFEGEPGIDSGVPVINSLVNPIITEMFRPNPATSANPLQIYVFIASRLWLIGIAALLLYTIGSYIHFRYLLRDAVLMDEKVLLCPEDISKKYIFQSDRISQSFVFGTWRPRVYIPFTLAREELDSAIAHEKMHIKRKDYIWKPFAFFIAIVYWFQPFVWVAYILFSKDIELACDERVIRKMDLEERKLYSKALLDCSSPKKLKLTCPLAFGENNVKNRIQNVLSYQRPKKILVAVACIVALVTSIGFMTNPVSGSKTPVTKPPTLALQDALSSYMMIDYIDSTGTYSWSYPVDHLFGQMMNIESDGDAPLFSVKRDNELQLHTYNRIDYVPYLISFVTEMEENIEPDRMILTEYDVSAINNMEAKPLQTTELTSSLVKIKPNRVYVLSVEWDMEHMKKNKCYGDAEYVFVTI